MSDHVPGPSAGFHNAVVSGQRALSPASLHTESKAVSGRRAREDARQIVVVLGMHRSGTSLLSNVLHFLSVDMADTGDHISPNNPGGFWERPELVAIQDEILEALGCPIGHPAHVLPFPAGWWRRKEIQALKPKLTAYIGAALAESHGLWGFKDPRTCRLLPLWGEVFEQLNLRPHYVHAIRTPGEAAASMSIKNVVKRPMSVAQGELMWLAYNYDIVRHTAGLVVSTVDYHEWFEHPVLVARRLVAALGVETGFTSDELAECVRSIVRSEFRNQTENRSDAGSEMSIARSFYETLAGDHGADAERGRTIAGQLTFLDMLFKSIRPAIGLLDELPELKLRLARMPELEAKLAMQQAAAQEDAAVRSALQAELSAMRSIEAEAEAAHARARAAAEEAAALRVAAMTANEKILTLRRRTEALEAEAARLAEAAKAAAAEPSIDAVPFGPALLRQRARAHRLIAVARNERRRAGVLEERFAQANAESRRLATRNADMAGGVGERQRRLAKAERLLAVERTRSHGLSDRLAAQSAMIRELEEELIRTHDELAAARVQSAAPRPLHRFQWPGDVAGSAADSLEARAARFDGAVAVVDQDGIFGWVRSPDRPDATAVVEAVVDGEVVAAVMCRGDAPSAEDSGGAAGFRLSRRALGDRAARRPVTIRIAGIEQELSGSPVRLPLSDPLRDGRARARIAADIFACPVEQSEEYLAWIEAHDAPSEVDIAAARAYYDRSEAAWPLVTVIVTGEEDGDPALLVRTLASIEAQWFERWEVVTAGAGTGDPRIRSFPDAGLATLIERADGEFVTFVRAGDRIAPSALLLLADAARHHPDFDLLYSDEDWFSAEAGERGMPYFKGAWSPDLALAQDYVIRLALLPITKVRATIATEPECTSSPAGVIHELLAARPAPKALNVPFILYHRDLAAREPDRPQLGSDAVAALLARHPSAYDGARICVDQDDRRRIDWPLPQTLPKVSLIVPTRDRLDLLRVCVEGILHETSYPDIELIIIDNDSAEVETVRYLADLAADPRVTVLRFPGAFDYSAINNLGVEASSGAVVGLLNNDLKMIGGDWLNEMIKHISRDNVGIVGAKLLYADDSIQHVGVVLGIGGVASHIYKGADAGAPGHGDRLLHSHDVSAVTAACLLIRRSVWDEVGGLQLDFPVAYNDVDLCLKVREKGYRVLWTPHALLYHLESQTRGSDASGEKHKRLAADKARLIARWGDRLAEDMFYSPNLTLKRLDARPAFPPRVLPPWRMSGDCPK